jgi:hypothetical protein
MTVAQWSSTSRNREKIPAPAIAKMQPFAILERIDA